MMLATIAEVLFVILFAVVSAAFAVVSAEFAVVWAVFDDVWAADINDVNVLVVLFIPANDVVNDVPPPYLRSKQFKLPVAVKVDVLIPPLAVNEPVPLKVKLFAIKLPDASIEKLLLLLFKTFVKDGLLLGNNVHIVVFIAFNNATTYVLL